MPALQKLRKILKITFSNKKKQELIDALLGYAATQGLFLLRNFSRTN